MVDFQTGEVYYEKNADVARPAASMTKVMSAYLVFEEIAAGRLSLDSYVKASSWAASISNNPAFSGMERLRAGQSYKVDTLLRLIMTESCNGSVIVLAEHIGGGSEAAFVKRMNDKAAEWGIDAHFADACGFMDQGNAVSPRAMAYIAKRIITDYPQILNYTSLKSTTFQGKTFYATNSLLRNGTCAGIDGLKTGTTSGAGYCFTGTAIRNGRRIISVVMNTTSYAARMSESKQLLEYGFACRTAREQAWKQAAQSLKVEVTSSSEYLWPYTESTLTATMSGLTGEIPCTLSWELNGTPIGTPQTDFLLKNGAVSTVTCTPPAGERSLKAALVVTLPDGTVVRREAALAAAPEDLSFTGRLGIRQIELYPEASITVPLRVTCDQGISFTVPAGWYLDGAPLANYQNKTFRLSPDGRSAFTLRGDALTPGTHVLEFRCNPNGLPGVEQASFAVDILVIGEETAPASAADAA